MTDLTTLEPAPDLGERAQPRAKKSRPRHMLLEVVAATSVAIGTAVFVNGAFGWSLLGIVLGGYLGFVGTVALIEFATRKATLPVEIDLQREHALDGESMSTPPPLALIAETGPGDDQPIRQHRFDRAGFIEIGTAAIAGLAWAELLRIVLRMQSLVGFAIWAYVAFLVVYFVLGRDRDSAEVAIDRVMTVAVWSAGIAVVAVLVWMIAFVVGKGLDALTFEFFTEDLSQTGPLTPGGGASHAIIGTLQQVGIATIVVVPVGIMTAVYLHEVRGRLAVPVRFIVDAMSGLPSIVAGLLVFTVWVSGHSYSGLAGAAALAVLMVPTMTRASEEMLRTVPDSLREGALALGSPHWRVVQRVVLPTAITGLVTAALLAIARAIGETAPVLLTALGSDTFNPNPSDGAQADLPLMVWKLIRQPNEAQQARAWTAALVLILLVFILFVSARLVANRGMRRLGGKR